MHGSLNAISRTVFKGAELPEYFVLTITSTFPSGTSLGTRAMIWPGLLSERRRLALYSVPFAALKNTPCAASVSSILSLSPSMMMSSPIV